MTEVEKNLILMGLFMVQRSCDGVDEEYVKGMTDGLFSDSYRGFELMDPRYARGILDGLQLRTITLPEAGL